MSIYAELSYQNQKVSIAEVSGIQFSILSPEEIVKRSVGKITRNDVSSENAEHMSNSLSSTRQLSGEYRYHIQLLLPISYVSKSDIVL